MLVSVRPEDFVIEESSDKTGLTGTVVDSIFLGIDTHYSITLESGEKIVIIQESTIESILPKGSQVRLTIKSEKINIFNSDGSVNLLLSSDGGEL